MKRISSFRVFCILLGVLAAVLFLASCTKNNVDAPSADKTSLLTRDAATSLTKDGSAAMPFEKTVYVPCANGAGEYVTLTGSTKITYQAAWNEQGFHMIYHENVGGVTGVGLTSNESFAGNGETQGTVYGSWVNSQFIRTMKQSLRLKGQNTSFTIRYSLQIIADPDGSVSFKRENETVDCSNP